MVTGSGHDRSSAALLSDSSMARADFCRISSLPPLVVNLFVRYH